MTITTGLHFSVSFEDKNACVGGKGKEEGKWFSRFQSLSIPSNLQTAWKQKLRWMNTVLAVCDYMSFAKSWQEKGCCSQAETWQVKSVLIKDFDRQVKIDVFVVSMAT